MKLSKREVYLWNLGNYEKNYEIREVMNPEANIKIRRKLSILWKSFSECERKAINEELCQV